MAGTGAPAGLHHDPNAREDVPILMRLPRALRGTPDAIGSIRIAGRGPVAVGDVTRSVVWGEEPSVYTRTSSR